MPANKVKQTDKFCSGAIHSLNFPQQSPTPSIAREPAAIRTPVVCRDPISSSGPLITTMEIAMQRIEDSPSRSPRHPWVCRAPRRSLDNTSRMPAEIIAMAHHSSVDGISFKKSSANKIVMTCPAIIRVSRLTGLKLTKALKNRVSPIATPRIPLAAIQIQLVVSIFSTPISRHATARSTAETMLLTKLTALGAINPAICLKSTAPKAHDAADPRAAAIAREGGSGFTAQNQTRSPSLSTSAG